MNTKSALILGAAIVAGALIITVGTQRDFLSNPGSSTFFRSQAAKSCVNYIRSYLRSPGSMKVDEITDGFAAKFDFPSFTVFVNFYAENRFGGSTKALATCDGVWHPTDYDSSVALPYFTELYIGGDDLTSDLAVLMMHNGKIRIDGVVPGSREIFSSGLAPSVTSAAK